MITPRARVINIFTTITYIIQGITRFDTKISKKIMLEITD